ncbi:MAG: 2-oxo-4-hydroxy-4-carboxy-5-ureidoimidazoline decarboxylase [Actinomycetota bacterium]|nr:2-oxo-4-hydroxy-4-carboxy-5-ureidoimidazoline decarboxylase [Actinomycetota bacterium]
MSTRAAGTDVRGFNSLPDAEVRRLLASCLDVPRWVEEVTAGRPYVGRDDLLGQARQSAAGLTPAEVESALARHPRIGEPAGAGHDADFSRREQSGVGVEAASVAEALRIGNARYEARFDRIFLVRAAGRSAPEILAELERRLRNSAGDEMVDVVTALGEIAVLRLDHLIDASSQETP